MTETPVVRDEKAGYSTRCRAGDHVHCWWERCTCPHHAPKAATERPPRIKPDLTPDKPKPPTVPASQHRQAERAYRSGPRERRVAPKVESVTGRLEAVFIEQFGAAIWLALPIVDGLIRKGRPIAIGRTKANVSDAAWKLLTHAGVLITRGGTTSPLSLRCTCGWQKRDGRGPGHAVNQALVHLWNGHQ